MLRVSFIRIHIEVMRIQPVGDTRLVGVVKRQLQVTWKFR